MTTLRAELGLSDAEADAIEAEVLKPHREYQEILHQCLERESPLSQRMIDDLKDYRAHLWLKPEDVATIERTVLNGHDLEGYVAELERLRQAQQQAEVQRKQQEQAEAEAKRQKQATAADQNDLSSERFGADYYAKLRDLLAAQDWKVADQETAKRMCQVMNPQEEGELLIDDFQRFPCQDLLNIDRLWVKYSNGQFGFSVQKAIYLECGGELLPISSTKSLVKNVERFGDRVGWRAKGIWLYHSDVTFSSFIPKGSFHLCGAVVVILCPKKPQKNGH